MKYKVFQLFNFAFSLHISTLSAQILPDRTNTERRGPLKAWNSDAVGFAREAFFPALRGPEASWGLLSFFQKRQFEDCPSSSPIEVRCLLLLLHRPLEKEA